MERSIRAYLAISVLLRFPIRILGSISLIKKLSNVTARILTPCPRLTWDPSKLDVWEYTILAWGTTARLVLRAFWGWKMLLLQVGDNKMTSVRCFFHCLMGLLSVLDSERISMFTNSKIHIRDWSACKLKWTYQSLSFFPLVAWQSLPARHQMTQVRYRGRYLGWVTTLENLNGKACSEPVGYPRGQLMCQYPCCLLSHLQVVGPWILQPFGTLQLSEHQLPPCEM